MGSRLGEIVVEQGLASEADVARGLARAAETGQRLGAALIELGLCDADGIATALASQHGVPAARDKHLAAIAPETRALLSPASAERWCAVPVAVAVGAAPSLVVAMRDPGDADAIEAIARETGYAIRPAVASERRIRAALGISPIGAAARPAALELAVAPRTRPVSTAPPRADQLAPRTRAASTAPPDGNRLGSAASRLAAASAASEPASGPRPLPWGKLLALIVLIGAGVFAYTWWSRNTARDVRGAYTSAYLDMEMQLPPGLWHSDPDLRMSKERGDGNVRLELLVLGPLAAPEQALLLGRTRASGVPTVVDDQVLLDGMRFGASLGMLSSSSSFSLGAFKCDVSKVRTQPTGVCRSEVALGGARYGVVFYMWLASIEDVVMVMYLERGAVTHEPDVEALMRSLALE